jgi:hypothetical protein
LAYGWWLTRLAAFNRHARESGQPVALIVKRVVLDSGLRGKDGDKLLESHIP